MDFSYLGLALISFLAGYGAAAIFLRVISYIKRGGDDHP
jgi:hypothetical protein